MSIVIKNLSGSSKTYAGMLILDQAEYTVSKSELESFKASDLLITDVTSGDASINSFTGSDGISALFEELPRDSMGRELIAPMKPSGLSDGTLVTHDLCDKTTWHQKSTEHTGVTLSLDSGTTYKNASHTHWIDLTHGKFYQEDGLADQKEPKIYDNGVEVTSGFTINYALGSVEFDSAPTGPVTADFWKAGSSTFTVEPTAGKILVLEHAELQFAEDVMMSSAITFEIWVYNPADLPNKVPYKTIRYKNIKDIINAANLGQGFIPKISGLTQNICVFPFNYIATKPLASSVGAELRISIEGDSEFAGEWATATFYFLSEDE